MSQVVFLDFYVLSKKNARFGNNSITFHFVMRITTNREVRRIPVARCIHAVYTVYTRCIHGVYTVYT